MAQSFLSTLDADTRSDVEYLVRESIGDQTVTECSYETCARAMQRSRYVASPLDNFWSQAIGPHPFCGADPGG